MAGEARRAARRRRGGARRDRRRRVVARAGRAGARGGPADRARCRASAGRVRRRRDRAGQAVPGRRRGRRVVLLLRGGGQRAQARRRRADQRGAARAARRAHLHRARRGPGVRGRRRRARRRAGPAQHDDTSVGGGRPRGAPIEAGRGHHGGGDGAPAGGECRRSSASGRTGIWPGCRRRTGERTRHGRRADPRTGGCGRDPSRRPTRRLRPSTSRRVWRAGARAGPVTPSPPTAAARSRADSTTSPTGSTSPLRIAVLATVDDGRRMFVEALDRHTRRPRPHPKARRGRSGMPSATSGSRPDRTPAPSPCPRRPSGR